MKTVEQQIAAMGLHWPGFEVTHRGIASVRWQGRIVGIQQPYEITIYYALPIVGVPLRLQFPIVRVIEPRLVPNPFAMEEAPLPHVYFDTDDLPNSALCLFDPEKKEWTDDDFIALTTVKWTADWLACYEGWRATDRWRGGGRHQGEPLKVAL